MSIIYVACRTGTRRKAVIFMMKSIGRFFLFFAVMLVVAAGSGCITYFVTLNMLKDSIPPETRVAAVKADSSGVNGGTEVSAAAAPEDKPMSLDFYVVRLEGENLSVYASCSGREEFLYNEPIYVSDLSEEDQKLLKNGVRLKSSSELTGFLENFTS